MLFDSLNLWFWLFSGLLGVWVMVGLIFFVGTPPVSPKGSRAKSSRSGSGSSGGDNPGGDLSKRAACLSSLTLEQLRKKVSIVDKVKDLGLSGGTGVFEGANLGSQGGLADNGLGERLPPFNDYLSKRKDSVDDWWWDPYIGGFTNEDLFKKNPYLSSLTLEQLEKRGSLVDKVKDFSVSERIKLVDKGLPAHNNFSGEEGDFVDGWWWDPYLDESNDEEGKIWSFVVASVVVVIRVAGYVYWKQHGG